MVVYVLSDPNDNQMMLTTDPDIANEALLMDDDIECREWNTDKPCCHITLRWED